MHLETVIGQDKSGLATVGTWKPFEVRPNVTIE
jgi:hypothetical protein